MTEPRLLRFYLDDGLRQSARDGQHNFIGLIADVVQASGYRVEYRQDSQVERAKSLLRKGYAMSHMADPLHDRGLTFRRVYQYPFWAIESSAKRWEWHVAKSVFHPREVPRDDADKFYAFWQRRLFGAAPHNAEKAGFVYIPLQGRLTEQRSFQSCSPIEMIKHVLDQDPKRPVVAALHPKEHCGKAELKALDTLAGKTSRLTITTGEMERHLTSCDYVVTQNSAAAFSGFFFGKPAILFGKSDFHHIANNVADLGVGDAFKRVSEAEYDFAGYIHWFWQLMSINAGRPNAKQQIRTALIRGGWPID